MKRLQGLGEGEREVEGTEYGKTSLKLPVKCWDSDMGGVA